MTSNRKRKEKKFNKFKKTITSKIKFLNSDKAAKIETNSRDTIDDCSPISHLNIEGMNREQAKEELAKMIDEKIERMQSRYSVPEYSSNSIFDIIQPERKIYLEEDNKKEQILENKIDFINEIGPSTTVGSAINSTINTSTDPSIDSFVNSSNDSSIDSTIDSTIDKIFACYHLVTNKIAVAISKVSHKVSQKINRKIILRVPKRLDPFTQKTIQSIIEKENKASVKMSSFITLLDNQFEKFIDYFISVLNAINHRYDLIRDYAELNKKKILIQFGVCITTIVLLVIGISNFTDYEYIYNGKAHGLVKNQEDVYKLIDII